MVRFSALRTCFCTPSSAVAEEDESHIGLQSKEHINQMVDKLPSARSLPGADDCSARFHQLRCPPSRALACSSMVPCEELRAVDYCVAPRSSSASGGRRLRGGGLRGNEASRFSSDQRLVNVKSAALRGLLPSGGRACRLSNVSASDTQREKTSRGTSSSPEGINSRGVSSIRSNSTSCCNPVAATGMHQEEPCLHASLPISGLLPVSMALNRQHPTDLARTEAGSTKIAAALFQPLARPRLCAERDQRRAPMRVDTSASSHPPNDLILNGQSALTGGPELVPSTLRVTSVYLYMDRRPVEPGAGGLAVGPRVLQPARRGSCDAVRARSDMSRSLSVSDPHRLGRSRLCPAGSSTRFVVGAIPVRMSSAVSTWLDATSSAVAMVSLREGPEVINSSASSPSSSMYHAVATSSLLSKSQPAP